ncbi:helix-turn-helix transcriptional regulator [Tranquillimonas alkanivorans]|uniref:Predicted DNA-binding transcriptional regulator YafY, contains an HTH and WYL domains n=1 Tax=Tranquillimonas alkanivorans TaxID=441119 RepID=A0A1I5NFA0_9RHOB|nr:YafY family protein [Tranquillimonas alkanivorans]SFP20036.1 Predicted DNA-binding transcriptional regulator YafY, contains an HTH and WYL domains [Tranquillimonas alkanivorans]
MHRTDRLYELIQILRDGRLHRAHEMARKLGVSLRTIYRDMETLMASGVPVQGSRGMGYRMTAPITLPPLNLTLAELEALQLGLMVVAEAGDDEQTAAAHALSDKIDAVLPEDRSAMPRELGLAVYPFAEAAHGFRHMPAIRAAIRARQKLRVSYSDTDGTDSQRTIRPLKLDYWGRVWTVTAWSETDADFRVLRADRIGELRVLPELFVEERGKTLMDYLERGRGS